MLGVNQMCNSQGEDDPNFTQGLNACGDHYSKPKIEINCLTNMNKLMDAEGDNILKQNNLGKIHDIKSGYQQIKYTHTSWLKAELAHSLQQKYPLTSGNFPDLFSIEVSVYCVHLPFQPL